MRNWRPLFLAALWLGLSASVRAQELQLTLSPMTGVRPQVGIVAFRATLQNAGAVRVFVNQASVAFVGSEYLLADPVDFYVNFAGPLDPGAEIRDKQIFTVMLLPGIQIGTYAGTV